MKKIIFSTVILAIFGLFMGQFNLFSQTVDFEEEKDKKVDIEKELALLNSNVSALVRQFVDTTRFIFLEKKLNREISSLRADTATTTASLRAYVHAQKELEKKLEKKGEILSKIQTDHARANLRNKDLQTKINVLNERITHFEKRRQEITDLYTSSVNNKPEQMSRATLRRHLYADEANRSDMSQDAAKSTPAVGVWAGNIFLYKVIVENFLRKPASFNFTPQNGGTLVSIVLDPKQKSAVYLVAGCYEISCTNMATGHAFEPKYKKVCREGYTIYKGEACHGAVSSPEY